LRAPISSTSVTGDTTDDEGNALQTRLLPLLGFLCVGCGTESPASDVAPAPEGARLATAFDATNTGGVSGRVTWAGPIPEPPPFLYCVPRPDGTGLAYLKAENPNRPQVDAKSKAIAGAVVFLRGIDPSRSRPWDLPPVGVEMSAGKITVVQGERRGRVGFVRHGEKFSATAAEPVFHILRGRGDAYFSMTLPEHGASVTRALPVAGRVELSSGTGLYWARADLFVADHPYFAVTDAEGRFKLEHVPTGPVEVVVWVPSWETASQGRNPDTTAISTMTYRPAIERGRKLAVEVGRVAEANFSVP
jgi:hypothetical protein